ncbi:hypothetical protein Tco_1337391 [Tanacetum coccineum]
MRGYELTVGRSRAEVREVLGRAKSTSKHHLEDVTRLNSGCHGRCGDDGVGDGDEGGVPTVEMVTGETVIDLCHGGGEWHGVVAGVRGGWCRWWCGEAAGAGEDEHEEWCGCDEGVGGVMGWIGMMEMAWWQRRPRRKRSPEKGRQKNSRRRRRKW